MTTNTGESAETTGGRSSPKTSRQGDVPANTFAARLVLARHHAGHLSIREAADRCELGRGAWTNWERGARPYDKVEVAQVISDRLGMNYHWLLYGEDEQGQVLLPAKGRLTRRVGDPNWRYRGRSVRSTAGRTYDRYVTATESRLRMGRSCDRSQPVAA